MRATLPPVAVRAPPPLALEDKIVGTRNLRRILASALCALAAWLGSAAPAHATLIVGTWDPAYGAPFADLGWRGSATFYVADSCHTSGGVLINLLGCPAGSMSVQSARVEFYNLANPATTLQVLDFSDDMWVLAARYDSSGVIDGITALTVTGYQAGTINETKLPSGNQAYFALGFDFLEGETQARLAYATSAEPFLMLPTGFNNSSSYPAVVTLQTLPEPTAAGLALAALGLAGVATRRRRPA